MKFPLLFLCCINLATFSIGQVSSPDYFYFIKKADSLYETNDFKNSALNYSLAFKTNNWNGRTTDRYNAACSWALAGNADSAFSQLYRITKTYYSYYNHIIEDNDLVSLHNDQRWKPLMDTFKINKENAEAKLNKPLAALLDTIYNSDQGDRRKIATIQQQHGEQSKQMDSLWKKITYEDSINLIEVKKIIDTYGWLGPDEIGQQGSSTLFLVIQHSDSLTQVTYLPLMRKAVKEGKAQPQELALLEDRVLIKQGKKQIYGSQIRSDSKTGKYYVLPLEDPDNVDKRRMEVGLEPLAGYVSHWNIIWNVEQYKKDLPDIEANEK
jgi:hypothetical protein